MDAKMLSSALSGRLHLLPMPCQGAAQRVRDAALLFNEVDEQTFQKSRICHNEGILSQVLQDLQRNECATQDDIFPSRLQPGNSLPRRNRKAGQAIDGAPEPTLIQGEP